MNNKFETLTRYIFWITAALAFVYIILKAYLMDITHDEAYSLLLVDTNYLRAMAGTANTHWINSIFMKLFSVTLGIQPWMLRIHSVIMFPVYTLFLFWFYRELKSVGARFLLLTFLIANHFTLEYFSIARGYAMSLSFLTGAFFFSYKVLNQEKPEFKNLKIAIFLGIAAVASNYTAFFQFCGMVGFLLLYIYFNNKDLKQFFQKKYIIVFILIAITSVVTITNLLMIKILSNDLRFGGDYSFFTNTLDSIIYFMKFEESINNNGIFSLSSVLFFIALLFIAIVGIIIKNIHIMFFSFLFLFQFIIANLVFFLFETPFPLGRTALALFLSISFAIIFFVEKIKTNEIFKIIPSLGIFIAAILLFINTLNLTSSFDSFKQSEIKKSLNDMKQILKKDKNENAKILSCKFFYAIWINHYYYFYPDEYDLNIKMIPQDNKELDLDLYPNFEYLITVRNEDLDIEAKYDRVELINHYPQSGLKIYRISQKTQAE